MNPDVGKCFRDAVRQAARFIARERPVLSGGNSPFPPISTGLLRVLCVFVVTRFDDGYRRDSTTETQRARRQAVTFILRHGTTGHDQRRVFSPAAPGRGAGG